MLPQRKLFCHEYVKDFNATQAAIRAGYSPKTAKMQGSRLLTYDDVNIYTKKLIQKLLSQTDLLTLDWLNKVKKIIDFDIRKVAQWSQEEGVQLKSSTDLDDDTAFAIQEISENKSKYGGGIRIKACDKTKALDMLGRFLNAYAEAIAEDEAQEKDESTIDKKRERLSYLLNKYKEK